ncbi:MAG: methyltransferase [Dethiosulfovibrio peptidovorans]|nr:MAG: methyltransferase [Dethiosulfovibrio peptidovorans]
MKDMTVDELKGLNLHLRQPVQGPRVNVDTVLLAGFTKVKSGERVCELGCAHGAVSLILAKRRAISMVGVDLQEHLTAMARKNAQANSLDDKADFLCGDIRDVRLLLPPQSFDVVVSNPPYGDPRYHRIGDSPEKTLACHGVRCSVDDVASACRYLLRQRGRAYFVFSAQRLVDLLVSLRSHEIEPKILKPVHPRNHREATVFLVKALRGGAPGLRLLPPLIVAGEETQFSEELLAYYTPEGSPCP